MALSRRQRREGNKPLKTKACRRLQAFAHRTGVPGEVYKHKDAQGGPNDGPLFHFAIRGEHSMILGISQDQAMMNLARIR